VRTLLACLVLCGFGAPATAATFTVTSTADSGPDSLRAAILAANENPGADTIAFAIPGTGPHTIAVASTLPGINSPVLIDGYTQPGAAANTAPVGSNAQIMIELRSSTGALSGGLALLVGSSGSTIRGLAINRFRGSLINVTLGGSNCVITGNFVGTDPTGTIGYPDSSSPVSQTGLSVSGENCRIGGPARADRNVVSGMNGTGVYVAGNNVVVQGNLIGTNLLGTAAIPNQRGVSVGAAPPGGPTLNALIGGENIGPSTPRNVISGNSTLGVELRHGDGHRIQGNIIGFVSLPIFGTPLPNQGPGILVTGGRLHDIGSSANDGFTNLIGNNAGPGVLLFGPASEGGPQGVYIGINNHFPNDGPAIDLSLLPAGDGVTANDPLDADSGPNGLQNFPVLTQVQYPAGQTRVSGTLHSKPNASYLVDIYTGSSCDPSGHGPGPTHRGRTGVITNAGGNATFSVTFDGTIATGFATATATALVELPTSEFSACLPLGLGPRIFADGFEAP
jgi:hypothetical protein